MVHTGNMEESAQSLRSPVNAEIAAMPTETERQDRRPGVMARMKGGLKKAVSEMFAGNQKAALANKEGVIKNPLIEPKITYNSADLFDKAMRELKLIEDAMRELKSEGPEQEGLKKQAIMEYVRAKIQQPPDEDFSITVIDENYIPHEVMVDYRVDQTGATSERKKQIVFADRTGRLVTGPDGKYLTIPPEMFYAFSDLTNENGHIYIPKVGVNEKGEYIPTGAIVFKDHRKEQAPQPGVQPAISQTLLVKEPVGV
jgi:hypothetical protein